MVREMAHLTSAAKPTPFHHMLASIAHEGRLMRLYSQNIDGIDTQMPPLATNVPLNSKGPWPTTIQLHGGLEKMQCTKCGHLEPFNADLFDGPEPPLCDWCKEQDQVRTAFAGKRSHGIGRLRPRIVLYNEYNPDDEAIGNVSKADLRRVPDAVVVVGTSLKIPGVRRIVKEMCQLTRSRRDGLTAWVNTEPEPQGAEFKDCWDLVVRGRCDDVAELAGLPRWDQQDIGDRASYMVTGDEIKEKRLEAIMRRGHRVEVTLGRKRKQVPSDDGNESEASQIERQLSSELLRSKLAEQVQGGGGGARGRGIPTPSATPRTRSPLPAAKPRGRPRQSTLVFGASAPASTAAKTPAPAAPVKATTTQRKPRQTKAAAAKQKPTNTLNRQFKATKSSVTTAAGGKKGGGGKQESRGGDLVELLPALRPAAKPRDSLHIPPVTQIPGADNPPTSPLSEAPSSPVGLTISPRSKPRSLAHLID